MYHLASVHAQVFRRTAMLGEGEEGHVVWPGGGGICSWWREGRAYHIIYPESKAIAQME